MVFASLIALVIRTLLGALIGAVILRAACSLYNSFFGNGNGTKGQTKQPMGNYTPSVKSDSPYQSPGAYSSLPSADGTNVPEPPFGQAFMICLLASIVNAVIGFALGLALGTLGMATSATLLILQGFLILIGYAVLTGFIMVNLPTTAGRAAAVSGLFLLISIAIGIGIGLVVIVVMGGIGAMG